ncbi:MAG: NlpC/P60 family protein, partial [Coriobacteriaceae bacterium]|nr:NlpC/P60 family protein [Coriobacteriaceae bacterium]
SSSKSSSSSSGRTYGGGSSAVARAQNCLGAPYVYGAAGPSSFDCSGLVSYALTGSYGHAYVAEDFWAMPAVSNPQPGDVVACSNHHCGLYIGNGQMIEAPHTGAVVTVSAVRGKIVRP